MYDLAPRMIEAFKATGYKRSSRNGDVTRLPGITNVTIMRPTEKVCFFNSRDANPFFHLIEAMAMLAGKNSNPMLSFLAGNMKNFSDDGLRYNSFYGERARVTWGDQIASVIAELKRDPDSRQAVVNLSNPTDLLRQTKDKACNLCMIFSVEDQRLNMTTFNRSNDCVWGFLTGANMVHFPFFQEYVAAHLEGVSVGQWFHASANMHVYDWNEKWQALVDELAAEKKAYGDESFDPYANGDTGGISLIGSGAELASFDRALFSMLEQIGGTIAAVTDHEGSPNAPWSPNLRLSGRRGDPQFLFRVVCPAWNAFLAYKLGRSAGEPKETLNEMAHHEIRQMLDCDWRYACAAWINQRTLA